MRHVSSPVFDAAVQQDESMQNSNLKRVSQKASNVLAFDVSTCWANRAQPPVGITRTEIEFARRAYERPNTILTIYDPKHRKHVILPDDHARMLLGITSCAPLPKNESARRPRILATLWEKACAIGRAMWCLFRLALTLPSMAVLPSKGSAYQKRKRRALKVLANNYAFLPGGVRGLLERLLGAHPSRPKYLRMYETLKSEAFTPRSPDPLDFSRIGTYVSVGCSWDRNDLEIVFHRKKEFGFRVVTALYDLVPIVMPDVVPVSVHNLFLPYLCNLLWVSDAVVCISKATESDLEAFVEVSGAPRPIVSVCRLGFNSTSATTVRPRVADEICGRNFALYVATYEPRKNHQFIYFLWDQLVRRSKVAPIPLVLAGRPGWRTEDFLERVRLNRELFPEYVLFAEGLTDQELSWLYSECRFTVFPALYEGWGLPVSESLSHGKFCIAADNSSIPEAGQGLVRQVSLLDGREWLEEIERCIADDDYLRMQEEKIRNGFKGRSWDEAAEEFLSIVDSAGTETLRL